MAADAKPRVLLIDDELQLRELVSTVLRDEGFVVDAAGDTTLGGLKLLVDKPDLVLLDLQMPGVGGFTFLEYVNGLIESPPPVVILSGAPSLASVLRGVKLGAFSFVPKPIHFGRLAEVCRSAIDRASAGGRAAPGHDDRRRETRKPVLVEVRIAPQPDASALEGLLDGSSGRTGAIGEMIDMSAGGARIISMADLAIGERLHVLPSPIVTGSSVTLTAEVRWRETVETGHMYGLEFVDLAPEVDRLLRSHLGDA